jgi:integrase
MLEKMFLNGCLQGRGVMYFVFLYSEILYRTMPDDRGVAHIRIHDLRHTYAAIRLLKGHNIGDVGYQLGHADISTTYNIYTHWIPGKFKAEVDELDLHPSAPYTHPEDKGVAIK